MYEQLICKLCVWFNVNRAYGDTADDQTCARPGASYSAGHIDALLDVLRLMGHNIAAEVDEAPTGEVRFIGIEVDGNALVSDGVLDPDARCRLLAADDAAPTTTTTTN